MLPVDCPIPLNLPVPLFTVKELRHGRANRKVNAANDLDRAYVEGLGAWPVRGEWTRFPFAWGPERRSLSPFQAKKSQAGIRRAESFFIE